MWAGIIGILSGLASIAAKVLDIIKSVWLVNQGKELQKAELAKEEIEINRKQTEILTKNVTKEEVVKKMQDGTF